MFRIGADAEGNHGAHVPVTRSRKLQRRFDKREKMVGGMRSHLRSGAWATRCYSVNRASETSDMYELWMCLVCCSSGTEAS